MNSLLTHFVTLCIGATISLSCAAQSRPSDENLVISVLLEPVHGAITVCFTNKSDNTLRIWRDSNSWGWDNLEFVVIRERVPYFFRRNPNEGFTRNIASFETIQSAQKVERKANLFDGTWVSSYGAPLSLREDDTIIAAYTVKITPEAQKLQVWTGVACAGRKDGGQ